jgi:hypothetical protein
LTNVIADIDHLVFPSATKSSTDGNLNYFVTLNGDLTNPKSATFILYKDTNSVETKLKDVFIKSFSDLLSVHQSMLEKFSEISSLKCVIETDDRHFKNSAFRVDQQDPSTLIYFSCLISQTRNYHFEINFKLDTNNDEAISYKVNKGYAGYGDFTTLGSIDIDRNFTATLITKTNFGLKNTFEGDAENNLATSYVVVYKRSVSSSRKKLSNF